MKISTSLVTSALALVLASTTTSSPVKRQSSYSGYMSIAFKDADACIYQSLSIGNNAIDWRQVNNDKPIICPTMGTKGARDPAIVQAADGTYYIVATDLDIGKTTWADSVRTGSRSIFIWQSKDLIAWTDERLVEVEDATAGMVWAPSAVAQPDGIHVFWSSSFYPANDTGHTGPRSNYVIRHAVTQDFRTFSKPDTYITKPGTDIIDQELLHLDGNNWARLLKNETLQPGQNFVETSSNGLFGDWTRVANYVTNEKDAAEGAAFYKDNLNSDLIHMAQDKYTVEKGYVLYEKKRSEITNDKILWQRSANQNYPKVNKHGGFLQLTQAQYDALNAHYAS